MLGEVDSTDASTDEVVVDPVAEVVTEPVNEMATEDPVVDPVAEVADTAGGEQVAAEAVDPVAQESDNDLLIGGSGDDWIFGEGGDDTIFGGDSPLAEDLLMQMLADRLA